MIVHWSRIVYTENGSFVTPAEAGVQSIHTVHNHFLDSGLRRNDGTARSSIRGNLERQLSAVISAR